MRLIAAVASLWLLSSCASIPSKFDPKKHVVRQLSFWKEKGTLALPLEQKIMVPPSELLDCINQENIDQGWPNRPVAATLTADIKKDIQDALRELPELAKKKLNQNLVGIFIVNDLGGSADTDSIFDENKKEVAGFVALDVTVLNRKANEWLTWKENSPFLENPDYKIEAEIEKPQSNSRKNALQFILLHELAHVISIGEGVHPSWEHITTADPSPFSFSSLSWTLGADKKIISKYDEQFPERAKIAYYRGPKSKTKFSKAADIYSKLEQTNFVTLYATTNFTDDFAESFATYVHEVLLKRSYSISIFYKGKLIKKYVPHWSDPKFEAKLKVIESVLKSQ